MAQWHGISRRKPSGGRKVKARGKRSTEISTEKQMALIGESKTKIYRRTGGNTLVRVLAADKVSIRQEQNFFRVQAYVYALEVGHRLTPILHKKLVKDGVEE